jgi:subtilisin family serine protease
VAGVAPDARLVVAKVLGPDGAGQASDINLGIRWVVDHGARVVNISVGDPSAVPSGTSPLRDGIEYAWGKGAVPVLAAGNYGGRTSENYGALNALVVGATDRTGAVASYSSALGNAKWGLVAPGGSGVAGPENNVISTAAGGGYASSAGTSMAVPHVSGAVALLLAQGLSPSAAVAKLLGALDRVPCGAGCQGRLNVGAATGAAPGAASSATTAAPAKATDTAPPATTVVAEATTVASAPPVTAVVVEEDGLPDAAHARSTPGVEPGVEPADLAAGARAPLSPEAAPHSLVVAVAIALLLAAGGSVGGVWARRRLATDTGWPR